MNEKPLKVYLINFIPDQVLKIKLATPSVVCSEATEAQLKACLDSVNVVDNINKSDLTVILFSKKNINIPSILSCISSIKKDIDSLLVVLDTTEFNDEEEAILDDIVELVTDNVRTLIFDRFDDRSIVDEVSYYIKAYNNK